MNTFKPLELAKIFADPCNYAGQLHASLKRGYGLPAEAMRAAEADRRHRERLDSMRNNPRGS